MKKRFAGTQKERSQSEQNTKAKPNPDIAKQVEEAITAHETVIAWMTTNNSSQENVAAANDVLSFLKQTLGECKTTQSGGSKNKKGKKK